MAGSGFYLMGAKNRRESYYRAGIEPGGEALDFSR